jgi:hypothetical protein
MNLGIWLLVSSLAFGPAGQAATAPQPPAQPAPTSSVPAAEEPAPAPAPLPVSLDRIREALSQPPQIKPETVQPVFRVEVIGTKPNLEDLLGKEFWKGGAPPTPGGSVMSHQEFLAMVTPPEFRGTAMFTQGEALTVMATSLALQWTLQRAMQKYKDARTRAEQEAAKKEVEEALAALDKARADGGARRIPNP